jgi:hypothetical protein
MAKKAGTLRIGSYHRISSGATSYSNKYPWRHPLPIPAPYREERFSHLVDESTGGWRRGSAWEIEDFYRRLVYSVREEERDKLRTKLNDLKQQVI